MTVIVNCRFLTQDVTGVQRFGEEITKRLATLMPNLLLVAPRGKLRKHELGGLEVRQFGRLRGHSWEQLELAAYTHSHKAVLLSLANTGPVAIKRQVLVIHDLAWLHVPESYSLQFRTSYRIFTQCLARRVRRLVTVSKFSRQDIASRYHLDPDSIDVVPNAVDDKFRTSLGTRPKNFPVIRYFLVVSSLNKHKNVGPLVDAYTEYAHRSKTDTKLVLVGGSSRAFSVDQSLVSALSDGSFREATNEYARQSQLIPLGRVTDEELIWLYRHAKGFVFPSLFEGYGLPPLEAQACGCPVASSDAASLPEVLGDAALFFDARSRSDMRRALGELDQLDHMSDQEVKEDSSSRLKSWESSAHSIASLLDSV